MGYWPLAIFITTFSARFMVPAYKQPMQAAKDRPGPRNLAYNMEVIERRQAEQRKTFPLPAPAFRPVFDRKEPRAVEQLRFSLPPSDRREIAHRLVRTGYVGTVRATPSIPELLRT